MVLKAFNIFRLAGDMTHLLSIIVLLLKINGTKSCAGALGVQVQRSSESSSGSPYAHPGAVLAVQASPSRHKNSTH